MAKSEKGAGQTRQGLWLRGWVDKISRYPVDNKQLEVVIVF